MKDVQACIDVIDGKYTWFEVLVKQFIVDNPSANDHFSETVQQANKEGAPWGFGPAREGKVRIIDLESVPSGCGLDVYYFHDNNLISYEFAKLGNLPMGVGPGTCCGRA